MKLLIPIKFSELADAQIAPELYLELALFSKKVVFPVNVRVLLRAVRPHPNLYLPLNDLPPHWLHMNSVASARVMLVLCTASAVPRLSWKEQLTSLAYSVDCKNRAKLLAA